MLYCRQFCGRSGNQDVVSCLLPPIEDKGIITSRSVSHICWSVEARTNHLLLTGVKMTSPFGAVVSTHLQYILHTDSLVNVFL